VGVVVGNAAIVHFGAAGLFGSGCSGREELGTSGSEETWQDRRRGTLLIIAC